jgi:hypothetical protein
VTERYRIFAAVFLAVFVIGGGGFLVMGRGSGSPAAAHVVKPLHPVRKSKAKVAVAPPKLRAGKKMSAAPKKRPAVVGGVPTPLADALRSHSVVVLALVAPTSTVDRLTLGEARAGAAAAHAGFATINVSHNGQVAALSALIGTSASAQDRLLDAPAVLVFQRPQTLFVRFNGFSDADTIRQAAINAEPAPQS